jgi:hypothetical protein
VVAKPAVEEIEEVDANLVEPADAKPTLEPVLPLVTRKSGGTPVSPVKEEPVAASAAPVDSSDNGPEFVHVEVTQDPGFASPGSSEGSRLELPAFLGRLKGGAWLKRLPKFNWHMPTDPAELQVMGWLEDSDNYDRLWSLAKGRLNEERLAQVVFDFYRRSLIDLSEQRA